MSVVYYVNEFFKSKRLPAEIRYNIISRAFDPITLYYNTDLDIVQIYYTDISKNILQEWEFNYPPDCESPPGELVSKLLHLCSNLEVPYYTSSILFKKSSIKTNINPYYIKFYPHNVLFKIIDLDDIPLLNLMFYNNIVYKYMEKYFLDLMLAEACQKQRLNMIKHLLSMGANINSYNQKPMYYALLTKNIEIVEFLLHNGSKLPKNMVIHSFINHCQNHNKHQLIDLLNKHLNQI